jgi:uncharacterized repeat protein (TIGR03803 family)
MNIQTRLASLLICLTLFFAHAKAQTILYGLTSAGGDSTQGAIISLNPANDSESLVYSFPGGPGGSIPAGSLVYDPANNLFYGMTEEGGANNMGTIFSFNPANGKVLIVWSFAGRASDGSYPYSSLIYSSNNGLLYGLTSGGGQSNIGAIFSFNPTTGLDSLLYSFQTGTDGENPAADLVYNAAQSAFYGTTYGGGPDEEGTIFSFYPANDSESIAYSFNSSNHDGNGPQGDLALYPVNGNYYLMSNSGGQSDNGAIIGFDPVSDSEWVAYSFSGEPTDGSEPYANMTYIASTGLFYGMTEQGGSHNEGTIFSFNPTTGLDSILWNFGTQYDGNNPRGSLLYDSTSGIFYAMTFEGGTNNKGAIISFNLATGKDSLLWSFGSDSDGASPYGNLVIYNQQDTTTGIARVLSSAITIYPNPSTGKFEITGVSEGQVVEAFNYLGQKVSTLVVDNATEQMNLSAVASGLYIIRVSAKDGTPVAEKRIVKID